MSSGNETAFRYVPEVTIGTTPVDDAGWKELRYLTAELNSEYEKAASNEVRSDRQRGGSFITQNTTEGPIEIELSMSNYDDFLEAVMGKAWATDVLKVGSDQFGFSIEREQVDLTTAFGLFTGMEVNSFELTIPYDNAITGSFGFMGRAYDGTPVVSAVGTGTSAALTTNRVVSGLDVSGIKIDTVAIDSCPQEITVSISNNMTAKRCVGSSEASGHNLHTIDIVVTVSAYLNDTIWDYYGSEIPDNTDMEFEFTIGDGTNTLKFNLPAASVSSPVPDAPGVDADIIPQLTFTGHYDAADATTLTITRT